MSPSLTHFQDELRKIGVIGNYTREENLHLTLAFIGEYGDPEAVMDALDKVSFQPFDIRLEGYGCFGDLFWAGLTGEESLSALVSRIHHALSDAGIPFDRKRFRPHITLIRKASFKTDRRIPVEELGGTGMTVSRVSLMRSDRGKKGMIYTEVGYIEP